MKIAIIHRPGSFTERWIAICQQESYDYKVYLPNDLPPLFLFRQYDIVFCHPSHTRHADDLTFRALIRSFELLGIKVYPSTSTYFFFDDKISQQILFDTLSINSPDSFLIFSDLNYSHIRQKIEFPVVAKLRKGASSYNVKLINNLGELDLYYNRMFTKGICYKSTILKQSIDALKKYGLRHKITKIIKSPFQTLLKLGRMLTNIFQSSLYIEHSYIYLQKFVESSFDLRITIIGGKAFAFKRYNRKNDFRASGSGDIDYNINFDISAPIKASFRLSKRLDLQSCAYDYVFDSAGNTYLIEMSFGFNSEPVQRCPGYWQSNLSYIKDDHIRPEDEIFYNLLS